MQVFKYVIMQPCEYATIWVCDNQLLPHSGPIREFQLSLKSCKLDHKMAWLIIMYLDMISTWSSDYKPFPFSSDPTDCWNFVNNSLLGWAVEAVWSCWKNECVKDIGMMSGICLEGVFNFFEGFWNIVKVSRMLPHSGPTCNFILLKSCLSWSEGK